VALEMRIHENYFAGVLQLQALVGDLTLTSTRFAALGTGYSTGIYMPLVLHNPATSVFEIVYIVGHSASSNTVTVQRGKEGTSPQPWPANTQIIDAATARDLIPGFTRAALPADPFLGMRVLVTDESALIARYLNGWGPAIGMSLAKSVGPLRAGGNVPDHAILMAAWGARTDVTPNGSGEWTFNFRQAFPTACVGAFAWSIDHTRFIGWCTTMSENASSATFKLTSVVSGNLVTVTSSPLSLAVIAFGY
jgi:hypothetical protein